MNSKTLIAIGSMLLLGGCATQEGIRLPSGSGPSKTEVQDFNKRNAPSAELPEGKVTTPGGGSAAQPGDTAATSTQEEMVALSNGPRIIIIGNAMSAHRYDDPTLNQRYDNYLKKIGDAKPAFTREWYVSRSMGTVAVKISGIPGLYSRFYTAEVPKDLSQKVGFASKFGTFMFGTSADLVAAEIIPPMGTWLTRVLCSEKDKDFSGCEAKYQRGLYQSSDGKEVDEKLKVKDGGVQIDLATYQKLK